MKPHGDAIGILDVPIDDERHALNGLVETNIMAARLAGSDQALRIRYGLKSQPRDYGGLVGVLEGERSGCRHGRGHRRAPGPRCKSLQEVKVRIAAPKNSETNRVHADVVTIERRDLASRIAALILGSVREQQ